MEMPFDIVFNPHPYLSRHCTNTEGSHLAEELKVWSSKSIGMEAALQLAFFFFFHHSKRNYPQPNSKISTEVTSAACISSPVRM